jgi:hypothetical protein
MTLDSILIVTDQILTKIWGKTWGKLKSLPIQWRQGSGAEVGHDLEPLHHALPGAAAVWEGGWRYWKHQPFGCRKMLKLMLSRSLHPSAITNKDKQLASLSIYISTYRTSSLMEFRAAPGYGAIFSGMLFAAHLIFIVDWCYNTNEEKKYRSQYTCHIKWCN